MPKRLLLVDDDPQSLAVLEGLLDPLRHELACARDGRSALTSFAERRPDLVLLDLDMLDLDGIDMLTHIRAHVGDDYVPVILLAPQLAPQAQRARGLEAGADELIEKPLDGPVLRARVSKLLQQKESRDAIRRTNEELALRNVALERLQREQRELMAFIVHDLKNPLSVVWSSVEFARVEAKQPDVLLESVLAEASEASLQLRSMIDDLLTISRLEDAEFPIHPEPIVLSDLLREVTRRYVSRAQEKRVTLLAPQSSVVRVRTDRTLLQRVIENILDGSLRHIPAHGQVSVSSRLAAEVEIAVSNKGPTIPRSPRGPVLEKRGRRPDDPEGAPGRGGLGLYFCKRAVEALGGSIEMSQAEEWPTSFIVRLPAP